MNKSDPLYELLIEFFGLPPATMPDDLTQKKVANWDSFAMVQLIGELQTTFEVQFGPEEIEHLGSYAEIQAALQRKRSN